MREEGLTPDVPLGPFEGTPVTAYAAQSLTAKLHASKDCARLNVGQLREVRVPLDASMIRRMRADCAVRGRWARPGTALDMFLQVFRGWGLVHELGQYTAADPDGDGELTGSEVAQAAERLHAQAEMTADDPDSEEADDGTLGEAINLRDALAIDWCWAAKSLLDAAGPVARYPWLQDWAGERLDLKRQRMETLSQRAAQLLDHDALIAVAAAAQMKQPELPVSEPAFAVLGTQREIEGAVLGLWYEWHRRVSHRTDRPDAQWYLSYSLGDRLGNRRKGRDALRRRAAEMLTNWAEESLAAAARQETGPHRLVLATIPDKDPQDRGPTFLHEQLSRWEIGVLIVHTVAADWATRTFLLRVPALIAERLLADQSTLASAECAGDPADTGAYATMLASAAATLTKEAGHGAFLPGTLDDTPVAERRPVTLAEVRALRGILDERRQLFVACSATGGVEVLPLEQIEKRCENGWSGILLAEAGDLPSALIEPALTQLGETPAGDSGDTRERYVHPREKEFGQHLGADAGMRVLREHLGGSDDGHLERDLRVLALARGMTDLRELDGGYDSRPLVPRAVWRALVTDAHINLQPFRAADSEEPGEGGLGLPISPLANLQVYTTNADPRVEGKGHSPFCRHARGNYEGIKKGYDLVTVADLLRGPEPDWCSQCGGYALRRLNSSEVEYYRLAHILLDIEQELAQESYTRGGRRIDLAAMRAGLSDASQWLRGNSYPGPLRAGDAWRVQDAIRNLQEKAELINRYHQNGWPGDGTVIHLRDRRDASHPNPTNGKGDWRRSLFANTNRKLPALVPQA
jgi:hypothetical protein